MSDAPVEGWCFLKSFLHFDGFVKHAVTNTERPCLEFWGCRGTSGVGGTD